MQVPPRDEAMRGSAEWFQGRACRKIGARFRDIKSLEGSTQILFSSSFFLHSTTPSKGRRPLLSYHPIASVMYNKTVVIERIKEDIALDDQKPLPLPRFLLIHSARVPRAIGTMITQIIDNYHSAPPQNFKSTTEAVLSIHPSLFSF